MSRTVRSHYNRWYAVDMSQCGSFHSRVGKRRRRQISQSFVETRHLRATSMVRAAYAEENPDWHLPMEHLICHTYVFRWGKTRIRAKADRLLKQAERRTKRFRLKQADHRLLFEYWNDCL